MTWLLANPNPHDCPMPQLDPEQYRTFGPGSLWKCDDCDLIWMITGWSTPAGWGELHPLWKHAYETEDEDDNHDQ